LATQMTTAQPQPAAAPLVAAPMAAAPPAAAAAPTRQPAQSVAEFYYKFNAARWSVADRITLGATIVLLASLFLPWFSSPYVGLSTSGLDSHDFLILALFDCVAIIFYMLARAGWQILPFRFKLAHSPVVLLATGVNLLIVVVGALVSSQSYPNGWQIGTVIAVVASVVAIAPIGIPFTKSKMGSM
jgi:hypothetical protein